MTSASPFDFNQAGGFGDSAGGFPAARPQRPGGLTAICVIAIVLGALGLCMSLLGVAGLAFQGKLEKFAQQQQQQLPPGVQNDAFRQQMEMQKKITEVTQKVTHRHSGTNTGILILNLLVSAGLLAGGIATVNLSPAGRKLLVAVFLTAIVFEIVRAVVNVLTQLDLIAVLSGIPKPSGGPAELVWTVMKAAPVGAMVFGLVIALAMIVYYGIGVAYLHRSNILPLFERSASDRM